MIPEDLKIGDTFVDGGLTYEVQAIVPEGYISKRVEKTEEAPKKRTTVKK